MWFKEVHSWGLFGGVMYVVWGIFAFVGLSQYFDQGSSFCLLSNALILNVIGFLFLRQCLVLHPPSTETSVCGTFRKLPICMQVSQYVWCELMPLYDWRFPGVWGWWWRCDIKMLERWRWRMWEIECTSMVHCNNVYGVCDQGWYSHAFRALRDFTIFCYEIGMVMRCLSWDFVAFCCIIYWWDFLMILYAFCSAIFVRDFLLKC